MYKMRIPIREQLGLLVLLTCLVGLAVISIATWVTNHKFVLDIRASRLTLTASLKATQLVSNLLLMQSLADGVASRIVIQDSLKKYNEATAADRADFDWGNASTDLQAVFDGGTNLLLQAQIWPRTYDGSAVNASVIRATATAVDYGQLPLPLTYANGSIVSLGAPGQGYPFMLYPNLTFSTRTLPDRSDLIVAHYGGQSLNDTGSLLLGPWELNSSFSLVSLTTPVINNTSAQDVLGWITVILDGRLIYQVINSTSGMGFSSSTVIVGPSNVTNHFEPGVLYHDNGGNPPENQSIRFVIQPYDSNSRHSSHAYGRDNSTMPFDYRNYPAVKKALTMQDGVENNSGSMVSTRNEDGDTLAVGFALPETSLCDWVVLVEVAHSEVWKPIVQLRNILLACVFGTTGAMALLIYPIAHYFSRPIRRLRDATRLSTNAYMIDEKSLRPDGFDGPDDSADAPHKVGLLAKFKCWGRQRQQRGQHPQEDSDKRRQFRIPGKVKEGRHFIYDELTELTTVFNEMTDELKIQYEKLEERVKQRTMELEDAMKAAEAANESKTLFIANLSHELKTPLNGILGMTAVCMSEDDPAKIKKSLGIIYRSGDLLLNLLTDLLTFSKNQIGHQQLSLDEKEFRLRDMSTQLLAIFDKQARENNISLSVKFEGPNDLEDISPEDRSPSPLGIRNVAHMVLWGDQHRIIQVLINLISNSLKFTPPGGAVICTMRCVGVATPTVGSRTSQSSVSSHLNRWTSNRGSRFRGRTSVGSTSSGATPRLNSSATEANTPPEKPMSYIQVSEAQAPPTPPSGPSLMFEFEVNDTGPGVPENMQQRIFEPFMQGDLGLSKKFGGTGLGLAICSQLASLMRGSIKLHSVVGQGSTFTMEIPLRHVGSSAGSSNASSSHLPDAASGSYSRRSSRSMEATTARSHSTGNDWTGTRPMGSSHSNASAPVSFDSNAKPRLVGLRQPFFAVPSPGGSPTAQEEAREHLAAQAASKDHKIKVLVAEDNKTNQEVVLRMLKLEDIYDVSIAKDGQEALDKVKESMGSSHRPYDLLLMDIQMPVMDGLESTRLIREAGYSAPIVALTAYAEEKNVKDCFDSGMDYFLSKPIRRPALKHVLKTYCPPIVEEAEPSSSSPPSSPPRAKSGGPSGTSPPMPEPQSPISPMSPMSPRPGKHPSSSGT